MRTTFYRVIPPIIAASLISATLTGPVHANQVTVNFSAIYAAATCTITAPASVSFNQGTYAQGVPATAIQGEAVQQSFNLEFSDCKNTSMLAVTPFINVDGTVVTLNGEKLFSNNTGESGEAVGYGVRLSTAGNSYFNAAENLALNNTLSVTQGTNIESINNQQLSMKAVLTCGQNDCSDMTNRSGGAFTARVIFRLNYE